MLSRKNLNLIIGIGIIITSVGFAGCKTFESGGIVVPPPDIAGAEFVGMDTCAMCHEKIVKDFRNTDHFRLVVSSEKVTGQACEACHGAGSRHVDAENKTEKRATIVNPGKSPEACYKCHLDKKGEFNLEYHHPVPEGKMSCMDCHDPHSAAVKSGSPKSLFNKNELCNNCHKSQGRPFVYEHEAMREGCTVCHNVHGSINSKMLKQRDSSLCLKCHYQMNYSTIGKTSHGGFNAIQQGACFSGGCHTAVHGSNYDKLLFI